MHTIRTSPKATEHAQLCSTVWNFTYMRQEPQSTVTRISKLSPGAAWRTACRSPPVWEQWGNGRITTTDPTINRKDFSLWEQNRGIKPPCSLGFLEGFKKIQTGSQTCKTSAFPFEHTENTCSFPTLTFSHLSVLHSVLPVMPNCTRVGEKAIHLI